MEKLIFRSKKSDSIFISIYLFIILFLSIMTLISYFKEKDASVFISMGLIIALLIFFMLSGNFALKIIIENEKLIIRIFFTVYQTEIKNVTKIRKGETLWSGIHKYGTTTKGLIVFSKFKNDLYITPENEDLFFKKILEINPKITIERV